MRVLAAFIVLVMLGGCAAAPARPASSTSGGETRTIVAIGDSITDAVGFNGVTPTGTWLYLLLERLGETRITFGGAPGTGYASFDTLEGERWRAVNLGVSGQTTSEILARFAAQVPPDADVIIVQGGLNDVFLGIPSEDTAANMRAIVEQALAITDRVIVGACPPCTGDSLAQEDAIEALNAAYRAMCDELGASYADWYTPLLAGDGSRDSAHSAPDGVHPDARGQELLAGSFDLTGFGR